MSNSSIDWELCLKLASNKTQLASELLASFIDDLPTTKNNIISCFQAKQFDSLNDIIHKLHGACCYCGVPQLKEITYTLERCLKYKDHAHLPDLITALETEVDVILREYHSQFK